MPSQRNPLLVTNPSLQCFACGHKYDHLGKAPHPGVCSECGLRAVSFAGEVEVTAVHAGDSLGQDDMAEVYLEDETDRIITYYFTVDDTDRVASLYVARIEDTRLTPKSPHWSAEIVPDVLREQVESEDGFDMTLRVPNTSSERGSGR